MYLAARDRVEWTRRGHGQEMSSSGTLPGCQPEPTQQAGPEAQKRRGWRAGQVGLLEQFPGLGALAKRGLPTQRQRMSGSAVLAKLGWPGWLVAITPDTEAWGRRGRKWDFPPDLPQPWVGSSSPHSGGHPRALGSLSVAALSLSRPQVCPGSATDNHAVARQHGYGYVHGAMRVQ